jgi:hypothetical protein
LFSAIVVIYTRLFSNSSINYWAVYFISKDIPRNEKIAMSLRK